LPSVTFIRPEFSELFNVGPQDEYGRNDADKLGFFIVRVNPDGHRIDPIRSYGRTTDKKNSPVLFSAKGQSSDRYSPVLQTKAGKKKDRIDPAIANRKPRLVHF
jgi:hypothetical protein